METLLVDLLTRKGLIDTGDVNTSTIVVQSFEPESLALVKEQAATLPTAFLNFAPNPAEAIALHESGIIDAIHAAGIPIHAWTSSDDDSLRSLLALGVDGIFTNTPDLLRTAIDEVGVPTDDVERGNPDEFAQGCPGVAGRVTSNQGPRDVWMAASEGRGVVLVAGTVSDQADTNPNADTTSAGAPSDTTDPSSLPATGGGAAIAAFVALAVGQRRRG
jgi:glycerophosphoryl diester phosphodiesterase